MSHTIGSVGESAVYHDLIKKGYTVYFTMTEGAKFDFIAYKNSKLQTVEVKTTQRRNRNDTGWLVTLDRSRKDNSKNPFDNSEIDILAIYIEPEDRIIWVDAKTVQTTSVITVSDPKFDNFKKAVI